MTSSDLVELKDTISECSMDSAYQSQSGASRSGTRKSEVYVQDSRPRVNTQFVSGEIYSPALSSESYNTFADHTLDMSQMQPPSGTWDAPEDSIVYANYSAAQGYSPYTTTSVPQYASTSNAGMSSPWVSTEAQFQNHFDFTYPAGQSPAEMMFSNNAPQRPWNTAHSASQDPPATLRSSSSYSLPQDSRRTSAHDATFGTFVGTPASTPSLQYSHSVENEQSRPLDAR